MADMNENHESDKVAESQNLLVTTDMVLSEEQKAELKKFVGTEVYATATASLQSEVDEELKIPDVLHSQAYVGDLTTGS